MQKKTFIIAVVIAVLILTTIIWSSRSTAPLLISNTITQTQLIKTIPIQDLINMSDDELVRIKEEYILKMVIDTARTNNINPAIFVGLAWHESSRFKFANKKIKDSNGRFSYGLFMIQLETAKLYDKNATEEKLLAPTYNTYLAALIYKKNYSKYGNNNDFALAAHNAGAVYNNKITNLDFVKQVKTAIGDVVTKFDL
jgi:soluble lytic murein transglycosylase-like protein